MLMLLYLHSNHFKTNQYELPGFRRPNGLLQWFPQLESVFQKEIKHKIVEMNRYIVKNVVCKRDIKKNLILASTLKRSFGYYDWMRL
jgi:hypothetical protein